jgi:carboxymethylenebutenolidase
MCDADSLNDMAEYHQRAGELSRRRFGALTLGSGFAIMVSNGALAADLREADVEIKTADGVCDAYFVHPVSGKFPAVLIWPDIRGLRPAFKQMGKRLAGEGYAVLVVNPFYRVKRAPVLPEGASFADDATRKTLFGYKASLTLATAATDAKVFVAYLDSQPAVDKQKKIGTTGYCLGGALTLQTAAEIPHRIGAGASFHGGDLVTDKPDSPHLLVPRLKAQYLFAIADNDDKKEPHAKDSLREAFAKAKLPAEIEVYEGAMHGWCPPDSPAYNEAQAERAWGRMLTLFKSALGPASS